MIIMAERKLSSSGTFPFSFFTVFLFSHCVFFLYHLQCFSSVSVTLLKSNKEQLVKHSRKQKNVTKKCNLAVEEIRGGEGGLKGPLFVSSVLFIYLKGCTLYPFTLPALTLPQAGGLRS